MKQKSWPQSPNQIDLKKAVGKSIQQVDTLQPTLPMCFSLLREGRSAVEIPCSLQSSCHFFSFFLPVPKELKSHTDYCIVCPDCNRDSIGWSSCRYGRVNRISAWKSILLKYVFIIVHGDQMRAKVDYSPVYTDLEFHSVLKTLA